MNPLNRLPANSACWRADGIDDCSGMLEHAYTIVDSTRQSNCFNGITRWERRYADCVAFLEWKWSKNAEGNIIPVEPGVVRSNVLLIDGAGKPLLSSRRKAFLASIVYQVPWHWAVIDEIKRIQLGQLSAEGNHCATA